MDRKPDSFQETIFYEPDSLFLFHHNFLSENYDSHWHNAVEIIMPIDNTYTLTLSHRTYNLREHDILIVPPGEMHEIEAPGGKGQRLLLQFSVEALNAVRGFIRASYIFMEPWLITPENNPELHHSIKTKLYEMLDEFLTRNVHYNVAMTIKIIDIALQLARKRQYEKNSVYEEQVKRREHTERFNECIDYINQHYDEDLSLETVAQAVCFSKFHFSRWFRDFADMSFHDYLTKLRLDKAETMLLTTSLSVTEIALEAGFQSTNTFNRLFRKYRSCTPTAFRQLHHVKQKQRAALPTDEDKSSAADEKVYYYSPPPPPSDAHRPALCAPPSCSAPLIWADIPDPDVICVDGVYYMVSTTMYFCPGIPIMSSPDLVHWQMVGYVYDILDDSDRNALRGGAHAYGKGSWAACIRYHGGTFYVVVASHSTGKSYVFQTENIAGRWRRHEFDEVMHDPSLLFDDDGRVYIVYGAGTIHLVELTSDATAFKQGGTRQIIIEHTITEGDLPPEGAHIYKVDGRYYLFMIAWPKSGTRRRIELCCRADSITGPYDGRVVLDDDMDYRNMGVAQGGIVQSTDGAWYAMLFQDHGAVGRAPVLVSVDWHDGWPTMTIDGRTPALAEPSRDASFDIVVSDEFYPTGNRRDGALRYTPQNAAEPPQMLVNNTFAEGTHGWGVMDIAQISIADDETDDGGAVLLVSNRSTTASGPKQNVTGKVEPRGIYRVEARVKYVSGPPTKTFLISIRNGATWEGIQIMGSAELVKGEWTMVRGTYKMPDGADLSETSVFIETPWSVKPQKDKDMMDFYVSGMWMSAAPQRYNTHAYDGENDAVESPPLPAWQWNHNPDHNLWSLSERNSYLRLKSGYLCNGLLDARNTLTQRTYGGNCAAVTALDVSGLRDGDVAGLAALQEVYGFVGVKMVSGHRFLVMCAGDGSHNREIECVALNHDRVYLRLEFDFTALDTVRCYYSVDEVGWRGIGDSLHLQYRLSHFTGYRFALFYYSTQTLGGHADFDYFRLCDHLNARHSTVDMLNLSLDGDTRLDGLKNSRTDVSIRMDALPNGNYSKLYLSVAIPEVFDVLGVTFNNSNIVGHAEYTVERGRLRLAVTGEHVMFNNRDSDLFATLHLALNRNVACDTTVNIQPDYLFADGDCVAGYNTQEGIMIDINATPSGAVAKLCGNANPLITHRYGADPCALEYGGRLYIYLTGDICEYNEFGALVDNSYRNIGTICVISSSDLINWTDHGIINVAGLNGDGAAHWAGNSWAPSVACKRIDGVDRFFLYFANSGSSIGVLTADSPIGPWRDPIGAPLIHRGVAGTNDVTWCFDPAALVDDDGQGYLFFGGGLPSESESHAANPLTARVIRLGDDMISVVEPAVTIDAPAFFEDSGIHKHNGKYYYSYCSNFVAPHPDGYPGFGEIAYMVSDSPMGPYTYVDSILKNPEEFFGVGGNNHHCVFSFNNEWYITYHAQTLAAAQGRAKGYRSPHINRLAYFSNGHIRPIHADMLGVPPAATFDPYAESSAATVAWCADIDIEQRGGTCVTRVRNGSWIAIANADFGDVPPSNFTARVASRNGGEVEIRLDSLSGDVIGTLGCASTGGGDAWEQRTCDLSAVTGVHDVYFLFKGDSNGDLLTLNHWQFAHRAK